MSDTPPNPADPTNPAPVDDPTPDPVPQDPPKADPPAPDKAFTQADLDRRAGAARKEGTTAARQKLAEDLGVSVNDLDAELQRIKDAKEAAKSTEDRLRDENTRLKTEKEAAVQAALEATYGDRVENRLVRAKLPQEVLEDGEAVELIIGLVKDRAPIGSTAEDIDAAITYVREKLPRLFEQGAPTDEPKPGNVPSNPTGAPRKAPIPTPDRLEAGRKMAEELNAMRNPKPQTAATS